MSAVDDPKMNGPVYFVDHDFGEQAVRVSGRLWDFPALHDKQKAFLCITSDLCRSWLGLPLFLHFKMAREHGATLDELKELLLFAPIFAGYTNCLSALLRFKFYYGFSLLFAKKKEPQASISHEPMQALFSEILQKMQTKLDPAFKTILEEDQARLWSRPFLSFLDRSLIALAGCVNRNNLGASFQFHLQVAQKAGASKEQIRETILFVSEYGFCNTWEALEKFSTYTQQD